MATINQHVPVLAVDDRPENLLVLKEILSSEDLELVCAGSGEEALRILLKQTFALILMDVQMPGINGFETAELIRGNQSTSKIPIIFITAGAADHQNRFKGYESGAVDFLFKPIETSILRSKVRVFAQLYTQRKQLEDRTSQLQDALHAAEVSLRAKSAFLANVGHEIRTPMNSIIGTCQLVQGTDLSEQQRTYITTIGSAASTLMNSINNILDSSALEAGRIVTTSATFSPVDMLKNLMESNTRSAIHNGLAMQLELDPAIPPQLTGDAKHLAQILGYLLDNALKFTPSGSITLAAQCLSIRDSIAQMRFEVRDTGIGISPEEQNHLFRPFVQIDESTTRRFEGVGLGLAISRQLCTLLGGTISVRSTRGQGSSFRINLPFILPDALDAYANVNEPDQGIVQDQQQQRPTGDMVQLWSMLKIMQEKLASHKPCRDEMNTLEKYNWPDMFAAEIKELIRAAELYRFESAMEIIAHLQERE